jgi:hypothetical protein
MGEDLDRLVHRHLSQLVEVVVRYLEPWVSRGELRCPNAKVLVLLLIGIILSHQPLDRLFLGDGSGLRAMFEAFAESMALEHLDKETHSRGGGATTLVPAAL